MTTNIRVLALDVGGTNIRLGIVDATGHIVARQQCNTALSYMHTSSNSQAQSEVLRILASAINSILESHADIHAIGIGFPGFFRQATGILLESPNIPQLRDFPLAKKLSHAVSLPVHVQNDGVLAALGESRFGIGREVNNLLHLTLGTGVGGGFILNDVPYYGENGMAMEIGHLCVVPNGRLCGCGSSGCLEAYASASAVVARYIEEAPRKDIANSGMVSAQDIYHKALDGDETAANILHTAGSYLGQAIAETVKLLDVRNVSISGGFTGAWEFLSEPMNNSLNERLIPPMKGQIRVYRSKLEDDAGLLGAAILALGDISDLS